MSSTSGSSQPERKDHSQHIQMIKSLVLALRKMPLYPPGHRVIKTAIGEPFELLARQLATVPELTFGVKDDRLLIEDSPVDVAESWIASLISDFKKLNIHSITFHQGLTLEELESFLRVFSTNPDQLKSKGGLQALLSKKRVTHVNFDEVLYEKVTEDVKKIREEQLDYKTGAETDVLAQLGGEAVEEAEEETGKGDIDRTIAEFLAGRMDSLDIALGLFLERIKADTRKIAKLVYRLMPRPKTEEKFLDLLTKKLRTIGCAETDVIELTRQLKDVFPQKKVSKARIEAVELKKNSEQLLYENTALKNKLEVLEKQIKLQGEGTERQSGDSELYEKEPGGSPIPAGSLTDSAGLEGKITFLEKELELKTKTEEVLKKVNRKLAREKQRIDTIIRNIGDGLVVVDDQGKVLLMNPAAEKLLGTTQKEVLGKSLAGAVKEEHLLALTKGAGDEEQEEIKEEIEVVNSRDDTRRIIQASTAVVESKDGKTIGMVSMLHDVTRQKELNELKSKFVSLVSHELRTPLVAIEKNMSILLEKVAGEVNEDQEKFLLAARRNAERLHRLVNDILDLSRIEAGKMEINIKPVNLKNIIQETVSTLNVWAEDKKIKIYMELPGQDLILEADPDRITQVFNNLISNAVKFTPEGGQVKVSAVLQDTVPGLEGAGFIQVNVKDTGIGLAESDKERVFNRFEQVSLISPAGIGGTGLGLSITKEIIQLHSGRIWVESVLGQGCTFSFALPMHH